MGSGQYWSQKYLFCFFHFWKDLVGVGERLSWEVEASGHTTVLATTNQAACHRANLGKTSILKWATVLLQDKDSLSSNQLVQESAFSQSLLCSHPQALVGWWQRHIFKCMYTFFCLELYEIFIFKVNLRLFKVKNKYTICDLIDFYLYVKTVGSSVEAALCMCSPRRWNGPLIRKKKLRNTVLHCPSEILNWNSFIVIPSPQREMAVSAPALKSASSI